MVENSHDTVRLPLQAHAILFDLDDTLHYRNKAFRSRATAFAQHYFPTDQSETLQQITSTSTHSLNNMKAIHTQG